MEYRHYSMEVIFMAHGDDETEVELESLWETGVGLNLIIKTLKMDEMCPLEQGGGGRTPMMKNPQKGLRSILKIQKFPCY